MVFHSYLFILFFLPVSVIGYYLCQKVNKGRSGIPKEGGVLWLLLVSALFYGYSSLYALLFLLADCGVNYGLAYGMRRQSDKTRKRLLLAAGIVINIGALLLIRYYPDSVFIPLGISFITFSQLAFLVNGYREKSGRVPPQYYLLYILFFPKISSGPIALPEELTEQFGSIKTAEADYEGIAKGLYLFALGLAKKVLLADSLGVLADWGWSNLESLNSVTAAAVTLSYTLQIYFDFSGYSEMAMGVAGMFGIKLPLNFDSPYKASSIADFWDRWHMTLTRFFTRYLYIPLGGSRKGSIRTCVNVLLVFLVSGFWHGSTPAFVIWGLLHGGMMVIHRLTAHWWEKVPKPLAILATNGFVGFAWIFFRAGSISNAFTMIQKLFSGVQGGIASGLCEVAGGLEEITILSRLGLGRLAEYFPGIFVVALLGALLCVVWFGRNTKERTECFLPNGRTMLMTAVLIVWSVISLSGVTEFVYANF